MIKSQAPPLTAERRPRREDRSLFVSQLVERYRDPLMRHLQGLLSRRTDAEDVLQETCKRLLEAPHLDQTGSRARAYMFRIATNLACDRFRRRPADSFEGDGHEALLSSEHALDVCQRRLKR
jgi:DNA-directed RNA polymerase specialized sigma24 family protein